MIRAVLADEVDGQPPNGSTSMFRKVRDDGADEVDALLPCEERRLFGIVADADDQPVEEPTAAAHHVEMAEVRGIEDAGVDGQALKHDRAPRT